MGRNDTRIPMLGIPEPHYQCAGYHVFNVEANADNHSRNYDEGYRRAEELFWVTLYDRDSNEECTDFFCQQCLEALGKKTGSKKTLTQVIEAKTREALEEAHSKMLKTLHVR